MTTSPTNEQIQQQRIVFSYLALGHFLGRTAKDVGFRLPAVSAERRGGDLVLRSTDTFDLTAGMVAVVRSANGTEREARIESEDSAFVATDVADEAQEITSIYLLDATDRAVIALGPRLAPLPPPAPVDTTVHAKKKGNAYRISGNLAEASPRCVVMAADGSSSRVIDIPGASVELDIAPGWSILFLDADGDLARWIRDVEDIVT